jgi:hypothetical protein
MSELIAVNTLGTTPHTRNIGNTLKAENSAHINVTTAPTL